METGRCRSRDARITDALGTTADTFVPLGNGLACLCQDRVDVGAPQTGPDVRPSTGVRQTLCAHDPPFSTSAHVGAPRRILGRAQSGRAAAERADRKSVV